MQKLDMNRIQCLSGFQLKVLASILMTIDHIGVICFPQYVVIRMIGRIAFPIFAFLLVEGTTYTHDIKKYLQRLFVLAIISEIPYDFAFEGTFFDWSNQNIFFTLFLGVLCIYCMETIHFVKQQYVASVQFIYVVIFTVLGDVLQCDYGALGVLMIIVIYEFRKNIMQQSVAIILLNALLGGYLQAYAGFAVIPIAMYNGKRGYPMKYFFYAYYPIHLIVLWMVSMICCGR